MSGAVLDSGTAAETFANPHLNGEGHGVAVRPGEARPVYVSSQDGEVRFFSDMTVPGVKSGIPSALSGTSATLNGLVNPSGVGLVEGEAGCRFEWVWRGGL